MFARQRHAELGPAYAVRLGLATGQRLAVTPNPTAAPVMGLNRGDIVIAVNAGTEAGWRRVRRDGITGWVYARYLREIAPAGSTQTSPSSGRSP